MRSCGVRPALYAPVVALILVIGGLVAGTSAADCVIPGFLATGKTYSFAGAMATTTATVVEIDRASCWVKVRDQKGGLTWVNLGQVLLIAEGEPSPGPAPPRPRR